MESTTLRPVALVSLLLLSSSATTEESIPNPDRHTESCVGAGCEHETKPTEEVEPSSAVQSDDPVCIDFLKGRVDRVVFNHMHALSSRSLGDYRFFVVPGLAKVDINNGGRLLNVIRGYVTVHDYDAEVLAVTDDSRTTIPKSALNDLLTAGPGGALAGGSFPFTTNIFSRAGVVYIETEIPGPGEDGDPHDHVVYVIHGDRAQQVCTIDSALILKAAERDSGA